MSPSAVEALEDGLAALGVEEVIEPLLRYAREIELWNPRYGLVEAEDADLVRRHLLDSLAPLALLDGLVSGTEPAIVDVGSGAGLPGIPLALARPNWRMTLLERSERRCGFLRNALAVLGRPDIEVRSEDLHRSTGSWDLMVMRAVAPLDASWLQQLRKRLSPEGRLALYKGRLEKVREELDLAGVSSARLEPISVPGLDEERHLVLISASKPGEVSPLGS